MELLHMIHALRDAEGSNAKIETLRNFPEQHAQGLAIVVALTLDPLINFYVSEIDDYDHNPLFDGELEPAAPAELLTFLLELNEKGSANAQDREKLAQIKYRLDDNDKQVADLIVRRDLRCGMGLASFRKVWGANFVPPFEVALMGSYNEKKINKSINFTSGAFSELKSDGKRCIVQYRDFGGNKTARGMSRNGKPINCLGKILEDVVYRLGRNESFDLDGELVVLGDDGKILPRSVGNGIVARKDLSEAEMENVRFVVWDLIHVDEEGRHSKLPFSERRKFLHDRLAEECLKYILPTESKVVFSLKEAKEHYREMVERGEEGTILKNASSVWTPGNKGSCREANGFKFKEEFEAEFIITSWERGSKGTKYEDAIGGYQCESACGKIKFGVGSGLKDVDRFISDPDSRVGSIVTIKFNGLVMAKGSETWSLFLPRVIEHRDDKDEANTYEEVIAIQEAARSLGE